MSRVDGFSRRSIRDMGAMTRKGFAGDEKGKGGFTPDDTQYSDFLVQHFERSVKGRHRGTERQAVGEKTLGSIPVALVDSINHPPNASKGKGKAGTKRRREK